MIRRPPRSTQSRSSAASDVYKRQAYKMMIDRVSFRVLGALALLLGSIFMAAQHYYDDATFSFDLEESFEFEVINKDVEPVNFIDSRKFSGSSANRTTMYGIIGQFWTRNQAARVLGWLPMSGNGTAVSTITIDGNNLSLILNLYETRYWDSKRIAFHFESSQKLLGANKWVDNDVEIAKIWYSDKGFTLDTPEGAFNSCHNASMSFEYFATGKYKYQVDLKLAAIQCELNVGVYLETDNANDCLLYTSPSPRDQA
eukprot:TRINITY_DN28650_c0_g1_i1.p1 TRINITY_DN28650_c0_g1~~TRINITY_DN28650_c0_g1_i1.p1  ORF type:complete len:256 (+),score=55.17 TRINITY_DN28650_c0_g1_i1:9-776(+)